MRQAITWSHQSPKYYILYSLSSSFSPLSCPENSVLHCYEFQSLTPTSLPTSTLPITNAELTAHPSDYFTKCEGHRYKNEILNTQSHRAFPLKGNTSCVMHSGWNGIGETPLFPFSSSLFLLRREGNSFIQMTPSQESFLHSCPHVGRTSGSESQTYHLSEHRPRGPCLQLTLSFGQHGMGAAIACGISITPSEGEI